MPAPRRKSTSSQRRWLKIQTKYIRVNDRIRAPKVRTIGEDGGQIGIIPVEEALNLARERGLDLVEVSPQGDPPVCRIMDFDKYRYEIKKKERENKKKQSQSRLKEIKIRPNIDRHDYDVKLRHAVEFLQDGSKLRLTLVFRGREMAHQDLGRQTLDRLVNDLKDYSKVDSDYRKLGRRVTVVLSPTPAARRLRKNPDAEEKKDAQDQE